ncbi:MAG: helix-turn-helix transcriptional regulator [Chloroflexi bacterium]|nr:helix-turn-helix transcriptional regulator [Chloroflexota bacterium]
MQTYGQYCPVAKATELVADRWTPLILRELLAGSHHFNELERGLPGIARSLLVQRLRRLQRAGVVERRTTGSGRACSYELTVAGRALRSLIQALGEWGAQWLLGDPLPDELDGGLLLWRMRKRIDHDRLPRRRVVTQFDFRGARTETLWLLLEPTDVSICLHDPGFDVDVLVTADIATMHRVFVGRIDLADALRDDSVHLDGAPALTRAFGSWFTWSPFAETVRRAQQERGAA